jgi:trehalose 6-phosphate phosphatase
MTHLFTPEGDQAIAEITARNPLLALDFDGTLAPMVALPDEARTPVTLSQMLSDLADFVPVAIVSGRAVSDVSGRLGFVPDYLVGNHGAEGLPGGKLSPTNPVIPVWRESILQTHGIALGEAGILVEDKGYSISLHYRAAHDHVQADRLIQSAIASLDPSPRVIGGKFVVNLLPRGAPDKFHAVRTLAVAAGCDTVIFAGDDETDDVVFAQAPADWLTVRIENRDQHRARFHIDQQGDVETFLRRLLHSLGSRGQRRDPSGVRGPRHSAAEPLSAPVDVAEAVVTQ